MTNIDQEIMRIKSELFDIQTQIGSLRLMHEQKIKELNDLIYRKQEKGQNGGSVSG